MNPGEHNPCLGCLIAATRCLAIGSSVILPFRAYMRVRFVSGRSSYTSINLAQLVPWYLHVFLYNLFLFCV